MTETTQIPNENLFLLYINKANIIDYIEIGSGGYGKVFSAMYFSTKLAIKQTRKKSNEEFLVELSIINEYRHPYMPRFLGVSLDKNKRISIILQLIEGLTLDKYMKLVYKNHKSNIENNDFSEIDKENTYFITNNKKNKEVYNQYNQLSLEAEDINPNLKKHSYLSDLPKQNQKTKPTQKEIPTPIQLSLLLNFIDLSAIIYYIHGFNLIHRDLKPSNVIIEKEGFCRLLDFGISKGASNTETIVETGGTIIYMAPENFSSNANEKDTYTTRSKVSTKVDIWAFGCILSEVYSNIKPWTGVDGKIDNRTIFAKLFKKHRFPIPVLIKNNCRFIYELIEKCTEIYPERRICSVRLKYYLLCVLYYKLIEMKRKNGGELKMEKLRKLSISQGKDKEDKEEKALLKKDYLKLIKIKSNLLQLYKITNEIVIKKGFSFQSIIDNNKILNEASSFTLNIDNNKVFNLTDFNRKSTGITNFTFNSCVNCVGNDPFYFERGVFNKGKKYFKESINNKNDLNNEKSNENEIKIRKGRLSKKIGSKVNKYNQEDEWGD